MFTKKHANNLLINHLSCAYIYLGSNTTALGISSKNPWQIYPKTTIHTRPSDLKSEPENVLLNIMRGW